MGVTEVLGDIVNEEKPETIIESKQLCTSDASVTIAVNDCCVFKRFTSICSLQRYPFYLSEKSIDIKIDTLYRPQEVCLQYDYCPVWKNISGHCEVFAIPHHESEKFTNYMSSEMPQYFEIVHKNLFQITMFDDNIAQNQGKADIIPLPFNVFKQNQPQLCFKKVGFLAASNKIASSEAEQTSRSMTPPLEVKDMIYSQRRCQHWAKKHLQNALRLTKSLFL